MKIFILAARENWITDRLEDEWIKNNREHIKGTWS